MARLIKKIFVFLIPLIAATLCFIITDPYKTIFNYNSYLSSYMLLSRGNVSTMVYLKNYQKFNYNAFIFGSSRSCSHTSKEWKKYLAVDSNPYSFGAWNDNVGNISKRLKLIDSLQTSIKNVLIILDVDRAFKYTGDIIADHYLINCTSKFNYYKKDYINYLQSPLLLLTSIDYRIFHTHRAYMQGFIGMTKEDINPINNDWFPNSEKYIQSDSAAYYKDARYKFYTRPLTQQYAKKQIDAIQIAYLLNIYKTLKKHKSNYKIVISPLYDQIKINPHDLAMLNTIFGSTNVYDYSGINAITNNMYNYGNDVIHYRKKVGNQIYKEIYKPVN